MPRIARTLPLFLKALCVSVLVLSFGSGTTIIWATELSEKELEEAVNFIKTGIDLYKESDFTKAIDELNKGLSILEKSINQLKARNDLINAHLHLGLAYIGVNDTAKAKEQFKDIIRLDPKYSMDPNAYSRKVVSIFNETKAEYLTTLVTKEEKKAPPVAMAEQPQEGKKPFYKKWWFWGVAGVSAVAIGVAASHEEDEEATDEGLLFNDNFNDGYDSGWYAIEGTEAYWTTENSMLTHQSHDEGDYWAMDVLATGSIDWEPGSISVIMGNYTGSVDQHREGES